ncbi:nucleotidyl transferase AbiEii/AbiGii toxin family protein [Sinomicrobium soli]|uniref:nucleotidyl transferase AbiEii/AbiGii toxin family protein n=1 Tax=Sinomicrobium sp. N-1-3-6 TaxID=2219864 RepID=UPI000DCBE9BD|nr:nucleotidyl transferase AbiEii/AbiGii toxin family protein [Sinomicrobium sp. N-1-3-6]RAV27524.1 nucleotidyl transferase AbiEii/AbiGii toxin family protein [Sinomicrobium sp. N-1-3-6]
MSNYKQQVSLLLQVLPEVAKEPVFAVHGGTAINLFVRDMPRLSVDIDLTYIPIEDRETSLKQIIEGLAYLKTKIEKVLPEAEVSLRPEILKLQVAAANAQIKIEVNQINRGVMDQTVTLPLCETAQVEFDAFCAVPVVPFGQLYGGKICAALDRQHPRDLFDVKYLLQNEGFTDEIRKGVLLFLLSSSRPLHEMLSPNFIDQRQTLVNQFEGMSQVPFTYGDFEKAREELVNVIHQKLTDEDREFLLGFGKGTPDWSIYDFEHFPAVQWKLQNLIKLKNGNPSKYEDMVDALKSAL